MTRLIESTINLNTSDEPGVCGGPRLLFLVTEDWYFQSHRLGLARHARDAGYEVCVGTRLESCRAELEAEGFRLFPIPFERSLRHPLRDFAARRAIGRLLQDFQPDLVHLIALKPILLGSWALARGRHTTPALAAFTGLGYLYSSSDGLARTLRPLVSILLRRCLARNRTWSLVQNADDQHLLQTSAIAPRQRLALIAGAGVDTVEFRAQPLPPSAAPVVLLPARLLIDKGLREFVEAARAVKGRQSSVRFVLVGAHDQDNPAAVEQKLLDAWLASGIIEWWGYRRDMADVYAQASIVCLPSYREGLPKALLEAAACARPLIATDVPGCREICRPGLNGVCVPVRDPQALAHAIEDLLAQPQLRQQYGEQGRRLVEREFSLENIAAQTLALYAEVRAAVQSTP